MCVDVSSRSLFLTTQSHDVGVLRQRLELRSEVGKILMIDEMKKGEKSSVVSLTVHSADDARRFEPPILQRLFFDSEFCFQKAEVGAQTFNIGFK